MVGRTVAIVSLVFLLGGCSLLSDETSQPEVASETVANPADEVADGSVPSADAETDTDPVDTDAVGTEQAFPQESVDCQLTEDGVRFALLTSNGGDSLSDYMGDVRFYLNDAEVHSVYTQVSKLRPNERINEEFFVAAPPGVEVDRCSAEELVVSPEQLSTEVPADDDVSECQNFRRSEGDMFAYELTITNPSVATPASYTIRVGIFDPDGVRRATRLVLADNRDGYKDLAPGATVSPSDETLLLDYVDGYTCEVVSALKYTSTKFFDSTGENGAAAGSLNADLGFATGSAELTDEAFVALGPVVARVSGGASPVCVEGFADSVGSDADNLALSQARADAVADYLRATAEVDDVEAIGRGEVEAATDEVDDPALRRVDITLAQCPAS